MNNLIQTEDKGFGSFVVIDNDLIGNFINNFGFWELHLYSFYSMFLNPDDVIVDVGANIGFHTINMAKKCKKVYAFEPQPLVFNILSANILFNDLSNKVEHYRLALGDKQDIAKMEPLDKFNESNGLVNFGARGITDEGGEETVKVTSFDYFNIDVNGIKLDIQGYELKCLHGMYHTVTKNLPWILLENYEDNEQDEKVLEYLKSLDYEIYRLQVLNREDCICLNTKNEKHKSIKEFITNDIKHLYNLV